MSWTWGVAWVAIDLQIPQMFEMSIQAGGQLS